MKQFLLVVVLLIVAALIAACGAGSVQPQTEPAQAAVSQPAGAQPETTAAEALPPAVVEVQPQADVSVDAQPETTAAEALPPAAAEAQSQADVSVDAQSETTVAEALPPAAAEAQSQADVLVFEPQSNSEKAVTVQVTPLNLPSGGDTLDFEVAFNTHSVDLSFDPAAISVLRDDQGREYPAAGWEGSESGGHHRSGVLKFTAPENTATFFEVVIRDVAGVPERVFRWELNS